MEFKIHSTGEKPLVLRVPTYWDSVRKCWIGALHLKDSKTLIKASGKDSFELQNNFNIEMHHAFENEKLAEELISLFMVED